MDAVLVEDEAVGADRTRLAGLALAGLGARPRPARPAAAIALTFYVSSRLKASAEWISLVELGFAT